LGNNGPNNLIVCNNELKQWIAWLEPIVRQQFNHTTPIVGTIVAKNGTSDDKANMIEGHCGEDIHAEQ
jgi:hypothetical protein